MDHSMLYDVTMTTLIVVGVVGIIWASWKMNKETKGRRK